jgi:hypothetical protein
MVNIVIHDLCDGKTLDSQTMLNINGGIAAGGPGRNLPGCDLPKLPFPVGHYLPKLPFPYPIGRGVPVSPQEPFDPGFSPSPQPSEPRLIPI